MPYNKEKKAAYDKAHYEANKEQVHARQKTYRQVNREKLSDYQKAWYRAHREEHNVYQRAYGQTPQQKAYRAAYRQTHREEILSRHRAYGQTRRKSPYHGLTVPQKRVMAEKVGYCCEICGKQRNLSLLHVDHNHGTSAVRGLLCRDCNHMLGNAFDNPEILKRAIAYLEKYEGEIAPGVLGV